MADGPLTPPNTRSLSLFGTSKGLEAALPRLELKTDLSFDKLDASSAELAEPPVLDPKDASQGLTADLYPKAFTSPVSQVFPDRPRLESSDLLKAMASSQTSELSFRPSQLDSGDAALTQLRASVAMISPQIAALLPQSSATPVDQAYKASVAALTEADMQQGLNYTVLQVLLSGEQDGSQAALAVLKKAAQGTPPASEAEKQLLANYGYSFSDKGLVNELTGSPVSPDEIVSMDTRALGNQQLKAFSACLAKFRPDEAFQPSKAEQDLLAGFGLHVKDGKLLNLLGDRKPIDQDQLLRLKNLLGQIVREGYQFAHSTLAGLSNKSGTIGVFNSQSMQARLSIDSGLTGLALSFKGKLADVEAIRLKAEANRKEIEAVSTELVQQDAKNDATSAEIDKIVKTEQPRLEQRLSRVDRLSGWLKTLPQGEALDQVLARLTGPERAEIGAALEEFGIKPGPDGKLRLPPGMTAAQLGGRVQSALSQAKTELEALERQLQSLRDTLSAGMKKSATCRQKLDRLMNEQNTDLQNLGEADKLLRAGRDELLRYRQDPALWNSLKPEEQALVERMLKDSEQSIASTGQTLNLGHEGLEKAKQLYDEAVQKAERHGLSLSRADRFKLFLSLCKQQVDTLSKQVQDRLGQLQADMSDDERLESLLRMANDLEARAQLVPRPLYTGLDELADQWRELLTSGLRELKDQQSKASERDAFARNIDASRTAKLKESLEYHFKQLDQGSKLSGEQLKHWLEQSLKQFRQQNA